MKICIFPNDPIISYYNKGEIKERYFNPKNIFKEIHIISLTKNDIEEYKVQSIAGNAILKIHSVGKINLKNHKNNLEGIINLVKSINPDIIRAYNPLLEGWYAAKCSKELQIPFFLSLHTQYAQNRKNIRKSNLKKYLGLKYTEKFIEPFVIKSASKITIVYKIIEPYVLKNTNTKPEVLYNKINCKRFINGIPIDSLPKPLIISVGRLIKEKNHQCLVDAMKEINAHLLIIGDGDQYEKLIEQIKRNELEKKIIIIKSIPNNEIQNYYKSAQIFALAHDPKLEGLPIPVIEAMGTGLPIVITKNSEEYSEGLENVVVFTERKSSFFAKEINTILQNNELANELSNKSLNFARKFDEKVLEKRESQIYQELVSKK